MNERNNKTVEENWNYLKELTIFDIGFFNIKPNGSLPWVVYVLTQKIKELEYKIIEINQRGGK